MLTELRVRNLAVVESATVRFAPGLNVVTGETGAGKSLLLAALALLCGGRWSREMLRTGADRMQVQAVFELHDAETAARVAELLGTDAPTALPYELLVTRSIDAAGRNRAEIDGQLVAVATLRELGALLAEIHGQSEHQALLDATRQTELLDRAAGLVALREAFAERLGAWRAADARRRALAAEADARARRIEELDALVDEVAAVAPEPGESDALRGERELLASAERHRGALATALALVAEGATDGDEPAVDRLGRAAREIAATAAHSPDARAALEALDAASDLLQEAARRVASALDALDADPERLEKVQARLEALGALLRRHGPTEEDALARAVEAAAESKRLAGDESDAASLAREVARLAEQALSAGHALDDARRAAGVAFAERVAAALAELQMPRTRFAVDVPRRDDADALEAATPLGLGPVEFLVAPNVGEELRPLARSASGGELARTALAIKGELADADRIALLAFDEIDADVGPRLGPVIGRRLARLARGRQALVITHLPQVAAYGAHHLRVDKVERGGRTLVEVRELTGAPREAEIAEMIRGPGRAAEALDQARAMLAEAAAD